MNSRILNDEIFNYLANPRRRLLLHILAHRERCTVGELAAYIAEREADELGGDYIDHQRSIAISLVHNHLPRLTDGGVIEYDRSNKEVARTDQFDTIQPFLDKIDEPTALMNIR